MPCSILGAFCSPRFSALSEKVSNSESFRLVFGHTWVWVARLWGGYFASSPFALTPFPPPVASGEMAKDLPEIPAAHAHRRRAPRLRTLTGVRGCRPPSTKTSRIRPRRATPTAVSIVCVFSIPWELPHPDPPGWGAAAPEPPAGDLGPPAHPLTNGSQDQTTRGGVGWTGTHSLNHSVWGGRLANPAVKQHRV